MQDFNDNVAVVKKTTTNTSHYITGLSFAICLKFMSFIGNSVISMIPKFPSCKYDLSGRICPISELENC